MTLNVLKFIFTIQFPLGIQFYDRIYKYKYILN